MLPDMQFHPRKREALTDVVLFSFLHFSLHKTDRRISPGQQSQKSEPENVPSRKRNIPALIRVLP